LNYFSYFSEIEDTFIRRRGKHLLLSPIDWALIESWKVRGVPLHVALRGIEHAFDSYESKKRKRSVKSLLYCQEEVEAQYAEWVESRVGAAPDNEEIASADEKSPFPRDVVVDYLSRSHDQLTQAYGNLKLHESDLAIAVARAIKLHAEITKDYETASAPDPRKLEESLSGIDRRLDDAIQTASAGAEKERLTAEIDGQLKPYKRQMAKETYTQTHENLLRKRLRDHYGVPRLSLFYL